MITVEIGCVDDSYMECRTENSEFAYQFLRQNDHEGSSISIQLELHGSESYKLLEFLKEMSRR